MLLFHFAKYRFSFRKVQIFISQSKGFHFAKYRFHFAKYNFSRCYCKIVLCWYVDSLECRLRNYAKKLGVVTSTASPLLISSFRKFCLVISCYA